MTTIALAMNRSVLRRIAAALAIAMLVASLPSIGVIVVADKSGPSLTMDVCHPLLSGDRSPIGTVFARPAALGFAYDNVSRETFFEIVPVLKGKIVVFPVPPPPERA
jgi:hypothetical protein